MEKLYGWLAGEARTSGRAKAGLAADCGCEPFGLGAVRPVLTPPGCSAEETVAWESARGACYQQIKAGATQTPPVIFHGERAIQARNGGRLVDRIHGPRLW